MLLGQFAGISHASHQHQPISAPRRRLHNCGEQLSSRLLSQAGLLPKMIECSPRPNRMQSGAMRVALAAFLSMVTTAAAISQETTAERLDALEKRVRALEAIIGQQGTPGSRIAGAPPAAGPATSPAETERKGQLLLKLTKWSASITEEQHSVSYYAISYTLLNNYDKQVKQIDGSIKFFDLTGTQITELKIKLDRFSKIEPGKEASFTGFCGFNQSIDGEAKLKDLAAENVHTRLEVKRIMFLDKTIIDLR
jgi:hypothetical protein